MRGASELDVQRWRPACNEYLALFAAGLFDEFNQIQLIVPASELEIDSEYGDLVIGRPGVDGIHFCFRAGHEGVFAYYPIDDEHVRVAASIADLVRDWTSGSLRL